MKKILFAIAILLTVQCFGQDTVKSFKAPIVIRIPNDTIGTVPFGRIATAKDLAIHWGSEAIEVTWLVSYFDLNDSAKDISREIPPYVKYQTADKSIFIDAATGNNMALSVSELDELYAVKDSTGTIQTLNDKKLYNFPAGTVVMDGWSGYMFFSMQPVPLRTLVMSGGMRLAARGGLNR